MSERLNGKKIEAYLINNSFRFSGRCLGITDRFLILQSDRDGRIIELNVSAIETLKEVGE